MYKRSFFTAVLVLGFIACADSGTPDDLDARRGPLGKADAPGLCEASDCGGQSGDGCWCDDLCSFYGDCCSNKVSTCDGGDNSCGSFAGTTCEDGEYCHYDPADICGAADAPGTCKELPQACIEIFSPVCGCDGQTYGNSCEANAAGVSVSSIGECKTFCGGFAGIPCPDGKMCIDDPGDDCDPNNGGADCGGMCVDECGPVLCTLFCEDGFETDENGCEICQCKDPTPVACCDQADFPEFPFEPVECCENGTWQMTGSGNPCGDLGMEEGPVCEPDGQCCSLDDKPGENGNPFCIEGASCCADGSWQCNMGNGQPSCQSLGEACEPAPTNSCSGSCGGQSADGCWCDNLCESYGDCCDDKVAECGA